MPIQPIGGNQQGMPGQRASQALAAGGQVANQAAQSPAQVVNAISSQSSINGGGGRSGRQPSGIPEVLAGFNADMSRTQEREEDRAHDLRMLDTASLNRMKEEEARTESEQAEFRNQSAMKMIQKEADTRMARQETEYSTQMDVLGQGFKSVMDNIPGERERLLQARVSLEEARAQGGLSQDQYTGALGDLDETMDYLNSPEYALAVADRIGMGDPLRRLMESPVYTAKERKALSDLGIPVPDNAEDEPMGPSSSLAGSEGPWSKAENMLLDEKGGITFARFNQVLFHQHDRIAAQFGLEEANRRLTKAVSGVLARGELLKGQVNTVLSSFGIDRTTVSTTDPETGAVTQTNNVDDKALASRADQALEIAFRGDSQINGDPGLYMLAAASGGSLENPMLAEAQKLSAAPMGEISQEGNPVAGSVIHQVARSLEHRVLQYRRENKDTLTPENDVILQKMVISLANLSAKASYAGADRAEVFQRMFDGFQQVYKTTPMSQTPIAMLEEKVQQYLNQNFAFPGLVMSGGIRPGQAPMATTAALTPPPSPMAEPASMGRPGQQTPWEQQGAMVAPPAKEQSRPSPINGRARSFEPPAYKRKPKPSDVPVSQGEY